MTEIADPAQRELMTAILATVEREHGDDAASWLAMRLGGQPELRALRRAERDKLICQAIALLVALPATQAAERLSRMLDERLRAFDVVAPAGDALADLVDRIASLNDWRPLTWRRIHTIATGN